MWCSWQFDNNLNLPTDIYNCAGLSKQIKIVIDPNIAKLFQFQNSILVPQFSMAVACCHNRWLKISVVYKMHDGQNFVHPLVWPHGLWLLNFLIHDQLMQSTPCSLGKITHIFQENRMLVHTKHVIRVDIYKPECMFIVNKNSRWELAYSWIRWWTNWGNSIK